MTAPLMITVITPSFNQGDFIAETIESVLAQQYPHVEHIIVDACSTDNTSKVLARYPHLKVICEKDKGQSDALNKGFKVASGDVVGWLNADDKYLPGCFEAVNKSFYQAPGSDLIYGDYRLIDQKAQVLQSRRELGYDLFMLKYLHILYIPSTTTFFRRRIIEDGNFLNIDYHYAMDYEYFLRLALKGYRFSHIREFLADFRVHAASKSQQQALVQKEEMERALLQLDPYLSRTPSSYRQGLRQGLMAMARLKRYSLKLFSGAYCC